jgi:hypothetical protein
MMAILAGKLTPTRYHKISHNPVAIKNLLVDLFVEAQEREPRQIILDLERGDGHVRIPVSPSHAPFSSYKAPRVHGSAWQRSGVSDRWKHTAGDAGGRFCQQRVGRCVRGSCARLPPRPERSRLRRRPEGNG